MQSTIDLLKSEIDDKIVERNEIFHYFYPNDDFSNVDKWNELVKKRDSMNKEDVSKFWKIMNLTSIIKIKQKRLYSLL